MKYYRGIIIGMLVAGMFFYNSASSASNSQETDASIIDYILHLGNPETTLSIKLENPWKEPRVKRFLRQALKQIAPIQEKNIFAAEFSGWFTPAGKGPGANSCINCPTVGKKFKRAVRTRCEQNCALQFCCILPY
jgi:hypothetical protein